jgi:mono/diheme cytochrome c family protein
VLAALLSLGACGKTSTTAVPGNEGNAAAGKYLAAAANCSSCHSKGDGPQFAGGVPFETALGTIYSSNITSDKATGIGNWTLPEFRRAMHEGIAADGRRLFPAFPYTAFTKISDQDVADIFAYLQTITPISNSPPGNSFVFRQRFALRAWNALFFKAQRFRSDPAKSVEWNRGAYLVEALGHCSACHSPRNTLMAEVADSAYSGGTLQDAVDPRNSRKWSAVNLTSATTGLAAWSVEDLSQYLRTGVSRRAGAFGPMNEVIMNSLSKLSVEDVQAMAVYLKALPAKESDGSAPTAEQMAEGKPIYEERCAKCHQNSGKGGPFGGPPLQRSAVVQDSHPASLINIILYGPQVPATLSFGGWESMQAYGQLLDDSQVAALGNFIRGSWGNHGTPLTTTQVAAQR